MNIDREAALTLRQAADVVPAISGPNGSGPRSPNPRTLWNWSTRGCRGVVLETQLRGGVVLTTREALERFFARLTAARDDRMRRHDKTQESRRTVRRPSSKQTVEARLRLRQEHGI